MERVAEAEREYRKDQQKFSMDALAMLGNILKDISERKRMNTLFSIFCIFIVVFCCHEIVNPLIQNHLFIS